MTDSTDFEKGDHGLVLPLANSKNQLLQAKIAAKRRKLAQLTLEVDQNDNLCRNEELELVSLEQDNFQNTNLRNILRSQCQKEREAIKLARIEAENIDQESKHLRKSLEELKQQHERQKIRLHEQKNDMERLQTLFEDESKIVDTMQKLVKSQEEDQVTLEKYAAQDGSIIKDLELKVKRAQEDIYEAETLYKTAKEDRKNAAVQLQQMQEEFASLLDDRDNSLKRCDATTQQIESCRKLLEHSRKEYQILKEQVNADQDRLDGINRCTKHFREDIAGLERAQQTRESFASQLKIGNENLEKEIALQQSEMSTMKKVIKRVVKDIIASRSAADELKKGIEELKSKLVVEQEKWKTLDEELKKARNTVDSSQAQKESLDRLAKAADDQLNKQTMKMNQLAIEQAEFESAIKAKHSSLFNVAVEIHNTVTSIDEIEKDIELAEQQIKQHDEMVYKKNIEILRMEHELRVLYRKEGQFEERRELKKKIDELKKEVETTNSYYVSLKYEFMKTQSDAIGLQRSCDMQQERQNVLKTLSEHLQSECYGHSKECNNVRRELEEIRMNESLLHLEIKRKEGMIQIRASTVQKLENQKRDIEKAIETRHQELMNEMELLQLDCRSLKERNQQLLMDANQKAAEIERIKLRYRLVAASLETESKSHEASEAYFIIKMVQEKEEVKETIEDLRNTVSKLEAENDALGNTIKLVASSNKQFRQQTILGLLSDDDKILKKNMEAENQDLQMKIISLRKEISQVSNRIEAFEEDIQKLKEESYHLKFSLEEKEVGHKDAYDELMQFSLKIERAKQVNALMQKQARKARKAKCKLDEEIEFQTVILREKWLSAQTSIFNLAQNDVNAKANLLQLLEEMASGIAPEVKKPQVAAVAPKIRLDITNFPTTITTTRRSPSFSSNSCLSGLEHASHNKSDATEK